MRLSCIVFAVTLPLLVSFVWPYKLVLKQAVPAGPVAGQFLRGYSYYAKSNGRSFTIECSLPASFNETVSGKLSVMWEKKAGSDLTIDPSKISSSEFKCIARNADGKSVDGYEDTTLKYYQSPADFKIVGPTISVLNYSDSTKDLNFACQSDNKPVLWFLDGLPLLKDSYKHVIVGDNGTLLVKNASYKDTGVYMCQLSENVNRLAFFSMEGKPYFTVKHGKFEDSENKLEGEVVTLAHELYGNPLSDLIWVKKVDDDAQEVLIDDSFVKNDPRFKFFPSSNVSNGVLEISDLKKDDRAFYISRATTSYGTSEFKTLVRVKGRLDALWPFLGIVAEVIILVAIILIYERRRLKRDAEADEALDQKKPLTSTTTNNDTVRQRKN